MNDWLSLSAERRRFGYRRLHILLRREGWEVNWKKLYRLYKEEKLTVRKRGGQKAGPGYKSTDGYAARQEPEMVTWTLYPTRLWMVAGSASCV